MLLSQEVDEDDPSDVLAAGLGKGSPTKLVHPPTGLTPRFENGAVNQVAGMFGMVLRSFVCVPQSVIVLHPFSIHAAVPTCWKASY